MYYRIREDGQEIFRYEVDMSSEPFGVRSAPVVVEATNEIAAMASVTGDRWFRPRDNSQFSMVVSGQARNYLSASGLFVCCRVLG